MVRMIWLLPLLLCGCLDNPAPEPDPVPVPSGIAREAMLDEIAMRADLADRIAGRIERGEIDSASRMADEFINGVAITREKAWLPVNESLNEATADGFDADQMAEMWRGFGSQWRSIR